MACFRIPSVFLLAGALACSGPVLADVTGAASLGKVGFMLTDLDPDDGIAPALAFRPDPWDGPAGSAYATYSEYSRHGVILVNDGNNRATLDTRPLDVAYSWQESSSAASLVDRADPLKQVLSAQAHVPVGDVSRYAGAQVFGDRIAFTITPNTAITFFSVLDADADAGTEEAGSFNAFARLELLVEQQEGWWTPVDDTAQLQTGQFSPALHESAYLFTSYSHRSEAYALAYVELTLGVGVQSLAPIPEPSQAAMLGGGVLLLGAVGMTRSRRAGSRRPACHPERA